MKAHLGECGGKAMFQHFGHFAVVAWFLVVALPGCSGQRDWEITAENKANAPYSIFVKHATSGGSGNAKVDDLAKGKASTLVGGKGETVIETVKVVRGKDEQILTPNAKLQAGKRYAIVVTEDGKLETSISDR